MLIKSWTGFNKRKNSTKLPTAAGVETNVKLKDTTSILSPVFEVRGLSDDVNYIEAFGRKYFVSDVAHVTNDIKNIICNEDTLGTWKSYISNTSAHVLYTSSSDKINILDPRNMPTNSFDESITNVLDLASFGFNTNGSYIIGVAGGVGGITHYVVSGTTLETLYNELFGTNFWTQMQDKFFSFDTAIVSCRWVPYSPAGTQHHIWVAGHECDAIGFSINSRMANIDEASYNINFPSDSLGLGTAYIDNAPYTTGSLYLPFVGVVPLDLDIIGPSKQIRIKISIDNYTGDIAYKLSNASGDFISSYQGNCSTNIPLSAAHYDAAGAAGGILATVGGLVTTVAGFASGHPEIGIAGLGSTGAGVGTTVASFSTHTQVNGSLSSAVASELGLRIIASVITRKPTEENLKAFKASRGMPFNEVATIGNLSGFVQCQNASVSMPGLEAEKDAVNNYLNTGFYFE